MSLGKIILCTLTLAGLLPAKVSAQDIGAELRQLDATIKMADEYYRNKETLISSLESLLTYPNTSPEQQFTIYGQLYKENYAYSFDRALSALNSQEEIARDLTEQDRMQVRLDKAMLFATAGFYLEAREIIDGQLDTTRMTQGQLLEYYYTMHRFWKDYKEYTDGKNITGEPVPSRYRYFRDKYIECTDESDFRHRQLEIFNLMDDERTEEADVKNMGLLSSLDSLSHEYAIMSYYQALISERKGDYEARLHWLIKSAIVDFRNAVRDYASLSTIATDILDSDVERSSRYIQRCIDDALFYNAKLRPWQLVRLLPDIDNAYKRQQQQARDTMTKNMRVMSVISVVLLLVLAALLFFFKRKADASNDLAFQLEECRGKLDSMTKANAAVTDAFDRLSASNNTKKEQIVSLLSVCNSYLDKAKRNLSPEQKEAELRQYYSAFDNAFLQMYPTFVEDFNALLRPDQRIELKKDDILNTELRIFALIRLGVTQSSTIASLLRYSVNTIYNYRAQIKNAALNEREDFEKSVKKIGSIEF